MAKGNIYYITDNREHDAGISATQYADKLDMVGADYVTDQDEESSKVPLAWLETAMAGLGAVIEHHDDGPFPFSFLFRQTSRAQSLWFKPKLEALKKEAASLTLPQVIRSAPSLDYLLNNDIAGLIELDVEGRVLYAPITIDDFMRQLRPGTKYWVYATTVMMH